MIELHIDEPGEGELVTIIDRSRLAETIAENVPYVKVGTMFRVDGRIVARKREEEAGR